MQLIAWLDSHAAQIAVCLALLTLVARAVAAIYGPTHPRVRSAVEALGALSPDPVRTIAKVYEALTGRRISPLFLLVGDLLRAPSPASSSAAADPSARPTFAPGDALGRRVDETTRAMRVQAPGTLGALALALALVVGLGGGAAGCATTAARAGEPTAQERAAATATTVLTSAALVRRLLCAPELAATPGDPQAPAAVVRRVLCDPAVGALLEVAPMLVPRSSGGDAPTPVDEPTRVTAPTRVTPQPPVAQDPGGPS